MQITRYATKFVSPYHGHNPKDDGVIDDADTLAAIGAWFDDQAFRPKDEAHDAHNARMRRHLGKVLRDAGILCKGAHVREYRVEPDAQTKFRLVVFPRLPGFSTYHHSITLTPTIAQEPAKPQPCAECGVTGDHRPGCWQDDDASPAGWHTDRIG